MKIDSPRIKKITTSHNRVVQFERSFLMLPWLIWQKKNITKCSTLKRMQNAMSILTVKISNYTQFVKLLWKIPKRLENFSSNGSLVFLYSVSRESWVDDCAVCTVHIDVVTHNRAHIHTHEHGRDTDTDRHNSLTHSDVWLIYMNIE